MIRYSCENGFCVSETKNVECANDFDCKATNQICDLRSFKCVDADVNLDGQKIMETPDNLQDCQAAGGTWKSVTTEDKSFLNYFGIGEPKVIVEEYCDMPRGILGYLGVGTILIIGALVLIFNKRIMAFLKPLLAKIGLG